MTCVGRCGAGDHLIEAPRISLERPHRLEIRCLVAVIIHIVHANISFRHAAICSPSFPRKKTYKHFVFAILKVRIGIGVFVEMISGFGAPPNLSICQCQRTRVVHKLFFAARVPSPSKFSRNEFARSEYIKIDLRASFFFVYLC